MYVNDFDMNGNTEQIICTFDGNQSYPAVMKDDLVKQITSLETKYKSFNDYRDQTIEDIFPPEVLKRSVILNARIMESCLLNNSGKGSLKLSPLPSEAQLTPVYAVSANDFDDDGICDIILGGNLYRAKPEKGIYDAGYGLFLKGKSNGSFQSISASESGIFIKGEIRDLKIVNFNGIRILVVAKNNDNFQFYKF
jgi:hypothetical protein